MNAVPIYGVQCELLFANVSGSKEVLPLEFVSVYKRDVVVIFERD